MTRARLDGLYFLLLGCALLVLGGSAWETFSPGGMVDFKAVYYGARCLLQHNDPYIQSELLQVYQAEEVEPRAGPKALRDVVTLCINLPTSFLFIVPFAMLPWGLAHVLWMLLTLGSLILAALVMWNLTENFAPVISGGLIGFLLGNSIFLLACGNAAGIAVSLCVLAVWCFLRERLVLAGIFCLAVSLTLKPHDAAPVWLYFLLAGGVYRKRALQTLALTAALSLPAILWVSHIAPHWMQELHANFLTTTAQGALNDPGPSSISTPGPSMVIDLQSVASLFRDDPRIYNPASYLVCGVLLLVWTVTTLRSRFSPARAWLALAAIAALSMLPVYHRQYDAKLLLLTVPACVMLWAEGGPTGRLALLLNTAGIVLTGDFPSAALMVLTGKLHLSTMGMFGKIVTAALVRPVPLILLVMAIFYLWVYVRRSAGQAATALPGGPPVAPTIV